MYNLVEYNFRRYTVDIQTIIVTRVDYRDFLFFFRVENTELLCSVTSRFETRRDYIGRWQSRKSLVRDLIVDALWLELRHCFAIRGDARGENSLSKPCQERLLAMKTRI